MNVFEAVKQSVTTRAAAESYGFRVNRAGKIICPFHPDKNPSMKVDKRFHCFGCGVDGDAVDFVGRLFGLDARKAAEKLAGDFGIPYQNSTGPIAPRMPVKQKSQEQMYRELEAKCFRVLSDYFHLLRRWEREYAPNPEDENWHPLFVEALQKKTHIEYLLDVLLYEPLEERAALINEYGKEVMELEKRLSDLSTGAERIPAADGRSTALPISRRSKGAVGFER